MIDQYSRTSSFGFISMGRSSSSSIIPGIMTCRIRPSMPASFGELQHLVRLLDGVGRATVDVGRDELQRDGVEGQETAPIHIIVDRVACRIELTLRCA